MKIVTVVGARPQFIKAAVVSRALRAMPDIHEVLIHTGQHYDAAMSDVFFEELEIPAPDHRLLVGSAPHGAQTGRMLEAIEQILLDARPDCVLVFGDTNSTLAGALAASKLRIPVAHVEAGLRSHNRAMPEEINRILTDQVSHLLLTPGPGAVENLRREGIAGPHVQVVGDVMYDAALTYRRRADVERLQRLGVPPGRYVLATIHRAENTDAPDRLRALFEGLLAIAADVPIVMPLHPRTRAVLLREGLLDRVAAGLHLLEPVGYLDMLALEQRARLIATDSGGVQKEAFYVGVPCVTLRDETEWSELVEIGWNRLVPPRDAESVREGIRAALAAPLPSSRPTELYGGGRAAEAIAGLLDRIKPPAEKRSA